MKSLMTLDHTAFQVRRSEKGRAGVGRSTGGVLCSGRHGKSAFRCWPCSRLAALRGATQRSRCSVPETAGVNPNGHGFYLDCRKKYVLDKLLCFS